MKTKIVFALAFLLIVSIACNNVSTLGGQPTTQTAAQNKLAVSTTEVPTAQTTETCGKDWIIKPSEVYVYPVDNSSNLVIIDLVIKNGTMYWGKFETYGNNETRVVLTTEDGSTFTPLDYNPEGAVYTLPTSPDSIYAGQKYWENATWFQTDWIAPGFVSNGTLFPIWDGSQLYHYHFAFRVPISQKHFRLDITNAEVSCVGGAEYLPTFSYDLDKDTGLLKANSKSWPNIRGKLQIAENQEIAFDKLFRDGNLIKLDFTAINNSSDIFYAVFTPYIIGADGIQRFADCGSIEECHRLYLSSNGNWMDVEMNVNPNQSMAEEIFFTVPSDIKDLRLVITTGGDPRFPGVPMVYSINPN